MKRPILYCAIAFCIGISLARLFHIPINFTLTACLVLIILTALFLKNNIISHIFLYLALLFFGAAYYQNSNILSADHVANFTTEDGRKISVKGVIADDPSTKKAFYGKEKTSFTLRSQSLTEDSVVRGVEGLIKVDAYCEEKQVDLSFGDEVILKGVLSKPEGLKNPGLFDYSEFLRIKGIYATLAVNGAGSIQKLRDSPHQHGFDASGTVPFKKWAYIFRHKVRDAITKYVDKPYSGFLNAILIGERSELDSSITDDFIKTGTIHVIAISGLNIALVAGIFILIFRALGIRKKINLVFTSIAIIFYCFVAGSAPPVVRATAVFAISSAAYLLGRESDMLNSLSIAAMAILMANPKELFDPSFQLSFASVISIVLFAPAIEKMLSAAPGNFIKSISVSIAASVGVFPIVAGYFNIVSPIAVIANLLIVPALFIITVVSLVFLFFSFLGPTILAAWLGALLSLLVQATFSINHIFSQMPFSHIRIPAPSAYFLIVYYFFLFWMFFSRRKTHLLISLLVILNLFVWNNPSRQPPGLLRTTFLDVGKGDAMLVELPGKGTMLIDGGSGGIDGQTDMGKNVIAPFLWNKGIGRLDAVVVTHFHEDHVGGILYLLKNFEVGCVMDNGYVLHQDTHLYRKYKRIIREEGLRHLEIGDGDEITGFGDAKFYVLNPAHSSTIEPSSRMGGVNPPPGQAAGDPNDASVVIKLEYKKYSTLFCGDISSAAMEPMLSYGNFLKSDVVKIPHHGGWMGEKSVVRRFFGEALPEVCVTSSGRKYSPHDESKTELDLKSVNYNTIVNGAVTIVTDGKEFKVKVTDKYLQK